MTNWNPYKCQRSDIKKFSTIKSAGGLDELRYQLLRYWSIKDYNFIDIASDKHFFDAFAHFDLVSKGVQTEGILEIKQRAKAENVQYIETMYKSVKHGLNLDDLKGFCAAKSTLFKPNESPTA